MGRGEEHMSDVTLVWATPDAERLIAMMARVSNPENQTSTEYEKLIRYLIKHKHWSPFEMVNVCMSIETTRDIARQILRHRSFTFQEFSQRYAIPTEFEYVDARWQDKTNRQNSIPCTDYGMISVWNEKQRAVIDFAGQVYDWGNKMGLAKEVTRKVLPEGLTVSRMYVNGTLRSWLHYCEIRCSEETQLEHREIAKQCRDNLKMLVPTVMEALDG
jgi:thymidylate synthase (FAD)